MKSRRLSVCMITRDEAAILYRRFTRKVGVQPGIGETPGNYASRVRIENGNTIGDVTDVTSNYLAARYGPTNPAALDALRESVEAFSR